MESKPDVFYGYLEEGVYGEFRHVPEPSPNKDKIGFIFGVKRYEFSRLPDYEFHEVCINPSLTIYQKWIYRINEGAFHNPPKAMEKPDFKKAANEYTGYSPDDRQKHFKAGCEHVWNTHVVPLQEWKDEATAKLIEVAQACSILQDENKALRGEIESLKDQILEQGELDGN